MVSTVVTNSDELVHLYFFHLKHCALDIQYKHSFFGAYKQHCVVDHIF